VSMLEGTTTIPVAGKVPKKVVVIGGAVAAGVVGLAWWRRSRSLSEETAPPVADPRTGSDLPSDAFENPGSIDTTAPEEAPRAPRTDQEWSQRVVEVLNWYEPGFVSSTVGKYLGGQILTSDEAGMVREAWALVGRPPGGQMIRTSPTPTSPAPAPKQEEMRAPAGLRATKVTRSSVALDWSSMAGPLGYTVWVNGRQFGRTVVGSDMLVTGLKPGTDYVMTVAGLYNGWKHGPRASITVRTAK
jgi:Fibronectin type III domain.